MAYARLYADRAEADRDAAAMRLEGWPTARVVSDRQIDPSIIDYGDGPRWLIQVEQGVFVLEDSSIGRPPSM